MMSNRTCLICYRGKILAKLSLIWQNISYWPKQWKVKLPMQLSGSNLASSITRELSLSWCNATWLCWPSFMQPGIKRWWLRVFIGKFWTRWTMISHPRASHTIWLWRWTSTAECSWRTPNEKRKRETTSSRVSNTPQIYPFGTTKSTTSTSQISTWTD